MVVTLRYGRRSPVRKEEEEPMAKKKRMRYKLKTKQVKVNRVRVNRKYKDTVFRILFSDKEHLLSLYNAVSGKTYTDPEQLQIVTLENAVYMGMKNDLAFIIDTNLFLYEHQSTYSANMPLRDLFYIASEYQKLVDKKSLYSSKLQKIPAPKFLVFYNGTEEMENSRTEYLSAAFENLTGEPDLELKVLTLNINIGHNQELLEQCRALKEYAQYVDRVRKYVGKMNLDAAVHRAVEECIREGILEDFLRVNRSEVEKVSIFEYDKEEEERKLREAEREVGREDGAIALITVAKRFHLTNNEIMKALCDDLGLDERTAEGLLKRYEKLEDLSHQNQTEVEKVSIFEYDKEEEERKLREAEREVGREQKAHEVANILWKEGIGIEKIAKIVGMEEAVIRKWINHW